VNTESEVNVFVHSVLHYFDTTVQQVADCGTPYLALSRTPEVSDYTGMIKISGKREGVVFFTAPKNMLCIMLTHLPCAAGGVPELAPSACSDRHSSVRSLATCAAVKSEPWAPKRAVT